MNSSIVLNHRTDKSKWFINLLKTSPIQIYALNLKIGQLKVEYNWPQSTYCQWLISAQDNDGYVTIEFQNFHVRNTIAIKNI